MWFFRKKGEPITVDYGGRTYDYVIPLGGNCETSWNIRNYFGYSHAYPFDWWITPFDSLLKILQDDFQNLLNPANIEIIRNNETVICNYYKILHHHDFKRDDQEKVIEDIEHQVLTLRQKYDYLISRFRADASSKKVLFIRNGDCKIYPY